MANWKYEEVTCPECGGSGIRQHRYRVNQETGDIICADCGHKLVNGGFSPKSPCKHCKEGKIKTDYIIITDPVEAACFVGLKVKYHNGIGELRHICPFGYYSDTCIQRYLHFKVRRSTVKEVCKDKRNYMILTYGMSEAERLEFDEWGGIEHE